MGPNKDEFIEIDSLEDPIMITMAHGNKVQTQGVGIVCM